MKVKDATAAYMPSAAARRWPRAWPRRTCSVAARETTMTEIGPASGTDPKKPNASARRHAARRGTQSLKHEGGPIRGPPAHYRRSRCTARGGRTQPAEDPLRARTRASRRAMGFVRGARPPRSRSRRRSTCEGSRRTPSRAPTSGSSGRRPRERPPPRCACRTSACRDARPRPRASAARPPGRACARRASASHCRRPTSASVRKTSTRTATAWARASPRARVREWSSMRHVRPSGSGSHTPRRASGERGEGGSLRGRSP